MSSRRWPRFAMVLLGASALLSCQSVVFQALKLTTVGQPGERTVHTYQHELGLAADVYTPVGPPRAVVVFFYGGSWQNGKRAWYGFVGRSLAERGYTVVIPDYRKSPEDVFPAFMEDAASAVRWVRSADHDWNTLPLFVAGHSAGAHIALLLVSDTQYLAAAGVAPDRIDGVVGISGPYDFLPMTDPKVIAAFGGDPQLAQSQPINFLHKDVPAALLLHGERDKLVLKRNSEAVAERLRELSVPVELIIYPELGHVGSVLSFARGFRRKAPVLQDVTQWLDERLETFVTRK